MKNVVIFGAGLHSNVCLDIFEKGGLYNVIGFIDSIADIGSEIFGYSIIGRQKDIVHLCEKYKIDAGFIGIGDNYSRKFVRDTIISLIPNFVFINAIHPTVSIGRNVKIGIGIAMMAGAVANPDCVIENFCILNTGAQLGHNSYMGEFSHLSGNSATAAKVKIGKMSAISLGVTIVDRINIGENTVVGIGSVLLKSLPDNVLAYGNPAKIIRPRKPGEKFLNSGK
jgi:sugar O-acyltransferase (sialic acid O-acetyltransferase NeuD family)